MIYFLAQRRELLGIRTYLELAGGWLAGRVTPIAYETLLDRMVEDYWWRRSKESWWEMSGGASAPFTSDGLRIVRALAGNLLKAVRAPRRLPPGTYVFADIERLSPEDTVKATVLWKALADSGGARLLNHPARSMRRYELLRTLHEREVNTFNVYRLTEARSPARYPVFLRGENDHDGPRSPLLSTREELAQAIRALENSGGTREGMIVTEFCDTADATGLYRTYGAFMVGDQVFPKHLTFSRHWAHKGSDLSTEALLAEEREYVEGNPHEAALREIFRLARVEYGRIDYGVLNGRVQVWEITTNPTIRAPRRRLRRATGDSPHPVRRRILECFEHRMAEALEKIASVR